LRILINDWREEFPPRCFYGAKEIDSRGALYLIVALRILDILRTVGDYNPAIAGYFDGRL